MKEKQKYKPKKNRNKLFIYLMKLEEVIVEKIEDEKPSDKKINK